jgi:hypothetical protein
MNRTQTSANTQLEANQLSASLGDFAAIIIVVAIIIVSGLVGGWAAHLTSNDAVEGEPRRPRHPYLLLGVIAAGCVPLFLSLIQSNLVDDIFTARGEQPFKEYLVFVGLCLIAAFSARSFIESVSRRVLRDLENVKEEHEEIKQQQQEVVRQGDETREIAEQASETAQNVAETVDEQDAPPATPADQMTMDIAPADVPTIDDVEKRLLEALNKKSYRTAGGVCEDSGMPRDEVTRRLKDLARRKVVEPTTSPKTGGIRWKLTPEGRAALQAQG